jgi:transposase-like protein
MRFGFLSKDDRNEQSIQSDKTEQPPPRAKEQSDVQSNMTHLKEKTSQRLNGPSNEATGKEETTVNTQSSETEKRNRGEAERKEERIKLYKRDDVRRLLGRLLRANDRIIPIRSPATGEYDYSVADFGLCEVLPLLNELQSTGILEQKVIDTLPTCRECHRSNFYVNFACPSCQKTALSQGNLLEHYACGYSDFETNFQSGSNLICPKCRRFLKVVGTDYRKIAQAYRCMDCGKFFGTPKLQFLCRTCTRPNFEQNMTLTTVYEYTLNKAFKNEVVSHVSLDAKITEFLKKNGYKVTMPMELFGRSKVKHSFDLGARNEKEKKEIVLDMVSAVNEVGPQEILSFFAKVYDTRPPLPILIAMPKIGVETQKLSAMYGLRTIVAEDLNEALRGLIQILEINSPAEDPQPSPEETPESSEIRSQSSESGRAHVEEIKKRLEEETQPETQNPQAISEQEKAADESLRRARDNMKRVMVQIKE